MKKRWNFYILSELTDDEKTISTNVRVDGYRPTLKAAKKRVELIFVAFDKPVDAYCQIRQEGSIYIHTYRLRKGFERSWKKFYDGPWPTGKVKR